MMDARHNRPETNGCSDCRDAPQRPGEALGYWECVEAMTIETTLLSVLSDLEALAQCVLFFLGGQDSMSSVIAHTVYLLALHQDVQAKLQEEIDHCFSLHGEDLAPDVVSRLGYLHAVVSESLRLFPPATRIDRSPTEDYVLGNTGITVPKGCAIVVPLYAMHRDPIHFPDPDSFIPERFSESNACSILPYTYLPFGAGPKACMGINLALLAVKLCLMHSLRAVQFIRTSKTQVPLRFYNGFGLLHSKPFVVGVRDRSVLTHSAKTDSRN
ncbi:unnamed protein product [Ixodes hexagonus]